MYCAIDGRLCLWEIFARINAFKRKSTCFANTLVYKWYLNLHTWEANGLTFCCSDFYGHLFFNQLSQQTKWHKTTINVKNVLFYYGFVFLQLYKTLPVKMFFSLVTGSVRIFSILALHCQTCILQLCTYFTGGVLFHNLLNRLCKQCWVSMCWLFFFMSVFAMNW